jgi:hypothetical protein
MGRRHKSEEEKNDFLISLIISSTIASGLVFFFVLLVLASIYAPPAIKIASLSLMALEGLVAALLWHGIRSPH